MLKFRTISFAYGALFFIFAVKQLPAQADSSRVQLVVDTSFNLMPSLTWEPDSFNFVSSVITCPLFFSEPEQMLGHHPSKADQKLYRNYKTLIGSNPTRKNHERYYMLACALWELEKTEEAKQMFLMIAHSTEPYYNTVYYHSSDLGRGKRPGRYGYGSYNSQYKHYASSYLAKIYAERKEYDQALTYVIAADTVYPLEYGCGTGYMIHLEYMQSLYALCYEGQGNYNKVVDLLLTNSYNANPALLRSLKKLYEPQAIRDSLAAAANGLVFISDSIPTSYTTYENYRQKNEIKTEISYTSGTAIMSLFGRQLTLHAPYLGQGGATTREFFVSDFLSSGFYRALSREE